MVLVVLALFILVGCEASPKEQIAKIQLENSACQNGCNHFSSALVHNDIMLQPGQWMLVLDDCLDICNDFHNIYDVIDEVVEENARNNLC